MAIKDKKSRADKKHASQQSVAAERAEEHAENLAIEAAENIADVSAAVEDVIAQDPPSARQTVTARCQEAKENSCSCRCRGKYHGKEHPAGWKDEEGCEPLSKEERKAAKRDALNAWRRAHPDRVATYMKQWRETSEAPTAVALRSKPQKADAETPVAPQ